MRLASDTVSRHRGATCILHVAVAPRHGGLLADPWHSGLLWPDDTLGFLIYGPVMLIGFPRLRCPKKGRDAAGFPDFGIWALGAAKTSLVYTGSRWAALSRLIAIWVAFCCGLPLLMNNPRRRATNADSKCMRLAPGTTGAFSFTVNGFIVYIQTVTSAR